MTDVVNGPEGDALDWQSIDWHQVEDDVGRLRQRIFTASPSKLFSINHAWLTCALTAIDLIAWAQTTLFHDQPGLAHAEPKTLRYRLLHVAARLVRGGRRLRLKCDRTWRWAHALARAFHRLAALPTPMT